MMRPVVIGYSGASVTLSNPRRHEVGQLVDVSFEAGTLSGDFSCIIGSLTQTAGQLETLYRTLAGEASLSALEDQLDVRFTASRLGGIGVHVSIHLEGSPDIRLQYEIALDQSFLPSTIEAMKANAGMLSL